MNVYPHDLTFDTTVETQRLAVLRAAKELELAVAMDGPLIRVTVRSPQETYRLGQRTAALLSGEPPPMPLRVPPQTQEHES